MARLMKALCLFWTEYHPLGDALTRIPVLGAKDAGVSLRFHFSPWWRVYSLSSLNQNSLVETGMEKWLNLKCRITHRCPTGNQFCFLFFHIHFVSVHFFFLGMFLIPVSCAMSRTSVHSSSGTLSIRSNPLNLSPLLYNQKGFDLGHTWMVKWFSVLSSV